jgi:hypothetical protein
MSFWDFDWLGQQQPAQPPRVENGPKAVYEAIGDSRQPGDDGSLRSARGELERAGIDPQAREGYEAIEKYARARMAETMKPPQLSTGELIGGALQNIGGVVAYAQGNPQFGASALSNNYITQHAKAAQDHKSQMSKLSGDLAMNTVSNFDKYYTGDLEARRKLKLQAQLQIKQLEDEKLPVPPSLYKAAGMPQPTASTQTPQPPHGQPSPAAAPPSGAPPVVPSGPLPQVPGVSAPAPAPQGAAPTAVPTSPQMTRLEAARNNQAAMEAFQKARIAHITGNKELGDAHMERFKQLSNLSSEEAEVLRGMDDPEFEKARLKGKRAGSSAAEPAYDARMGTLLADEFKAVQEGAGKASEAKAELMLMKEAIKSPDLYMGTGGEQVQDVKKALATVFGMDLKGVPEGAVVQRVASKIALSMKDGLPGPMSDSDRQFLLTLPPGLADHPESARRLVEIGLAQREWKIQLADAANDYVAKNGRLDQNWYRLKGAIDAEAANRIGALSQQLQQQPQAERRSPTAGTAPRVSTKAEFDALPSGAFFTVTGPDGTSMTKQKP